MLIRTSLAAFAVCALTMGAHAQEHVFEANGVTIEHPWARATAAGGDALVFMEITQDGYDEATDKGVDDTLMGGSSEIAAEVTIVGIVNMEGQIGTQSVGPVEIPVGYFDLDPGGLALELKGLTRELKQGDHFDMVVNFDKAGPIEIEVEVQAADAKQHAHAGHSH